MFRLPASLLPRAARFAAARPALRRPAYAAPRSAPRRYASDAPKTPRSPTAEEAAYFAAIRTALHREPINKRSVQFANMLLLSGTFLAFMVGGATFVNWLVEPDMRVPKMRVNPQTLAFELVEELQPRQQPQPPAAPTAPKS